MTPFYIFQWVLIYWLLAFTNFSVYNEPIVLGIMLGINIGVFTLLFLLNKYVVVKRSKKTNLTQQTV